MNSLACTLVRRGDVAGAITVATKALDVVDHAPPVVMDTLAHAHAGRGDLDQAVRIYRDIFASGSLNRLGARPKAEILFHGAQLLDRVGDQPAVLIHTREALTCAESAALAMATGVRQLVRELERG